jgi:TonB family protein
MHQARGISFAVAAPDHVRDNISSGNIPYLMAETPQSGDARANLSAGHLSVHVEGEHPPEISFSFEQQSQRMLPSVAAGAAFQAAVIATILILSAAGVGLPSRAATLPDEPSNQIVWIAQEGPGGGGGGGGNQMKEPPRKAEAPGKDKITVPVTKPPKLEVQQQAKVEPDPQPTLNIPAKELSSSAQNMVLPGTIDSVPGPPSPSQGSGSGGGSGTGRGTGIGSGTGSGLGPGSGGGTGGGAYRPGNGVTTPVLLKEVKPGYTSEAMRAKIQGAVLLQCTVNVDGTVGDIQVVRSLDPVFGLDQQAIAAARQWRFRPGTLRDQPVPVQITIELSFTLR